ncbi:MAG TPA: cellulose binding domain-containing protein [Actinoplanes sp.]
MRKLLTAVTALWLAFPTVVTSTAAQAAVATCTGSVQISSLTFNPAQGIPGQTTTATVIAQNCTNQPQQASVLLTGRFIGPLAGIPAGCPSIDPLPPQQVAIPPAGTYATGLGYLIFSGCTATSLQVTARFTNAAGAVLATQSATLPITQATSCTVTYHTSRQWPGGFVAQVRVANTGTSPVTDWSLAFAYPGDQHITSAWKAVVHQSGSAVAVSGPAEQTSLAAGATASFAVLGFWRASDAAPTSYTLNGTHCLAA